MTLDFCLKLIESQLFENPEAKFELKVKESENMSKSNQCLCQALSSICVCGNVKFITFRNVGFHTKESRK